MKIPKTLKIAGYNYTVEMIDLYRHGGLIGDHNRILQEIRIDSGAHKEQQESTLIHEALEAINRAYELDLEHKTICILETALYQMLKDNDMLREDC